MHSLPDRPKSGLKTMSKSRTTGAGCKNQQALASSNLSHPFTRSQPTWFKTIMSISPSRRRSLLLCSSLMFIITAPILLIKQSSCQTFTSPQTPNAQNQAFDLQLLNLLNSYANQQRNRPGPNQGQLRPGVGQQQASTPANPFASFVNQPISGGRPTNNLGLYGSPPPRPMQNPSANPIFVGSSSPPTPYLTLNRLASLANQNNQQQRPFLPINSIPMNNQQRPNQMSSVVRPPNRNVNLQSQPQQFSRPTNPPAQPRPVAGFAPSGPPPSQLSPNNALTVVASPTNAVGQTAAESEPAKNASTEATSSSEPPAPETPTPTEADRSSSPTAVESVVSSERPDTTTNRELVWAPVDVRLEANKSLAGTVSSTAAPKVSLAPSPDIVTVPPGYNPDAPPTPPQNYDISVSAQMGSPPAIQVDQGSSKVDPSLIVAPTEVTTIVWSPPVSTSTSSSSISSIAPTRPMTSSQVLPTRIRDNSSLQSDSSANRADADAAPQEVVYGKAQARESQPPPPPSVVPTPVSSQATIESSVAGRPFIQPVQIDNQVRPYLASAQQPAPSRSGAPFKPSRPMNGAPLNVGSGFTIVATGNQTMPTGDIQDYVAGHPPFLVPSITAGQPLEPTISAHGGQDPGPFDLSSQDSQPVGQNRSLQDQEVPASSTATPSAVPRIRRPTFKPKPVVPPIRIDSCIVGDDNSCEQSHFERCVTEYGISSCHCKPGYARLSQLRGPCSPVSLLQLTMKIDRLSDDRKLHFNQTLDNPNSEEYQYLEFETIQALGGAFQQTSLAKHFMGARVNKFFEKRGKVHANVSLSFELTNVTKNERSIQNLAGQELAKVMQPRSKPLGDSIIVLDGSKDSMSRLVDVNECASKDLNDCSKFATCTNDFGGFQCQCLPGYEDKHALKEKAYHGRVCMGCSASYCSNRGECSVVDGQKQCKCRPNFVGARCDIDSEVLMVAVGGSVIGIVILVVTFWCLFVFNRRWKREQQKMDAISATSGLTYNYVNSSSNSLMSPGRVAISGSGAGGLHRSGGHHQTASYGQRFINTGRSGGAHHGHHYPTDQQAIIGSTSSGSSAASQPLGCNPYATSSAHQHLHNAYQAAYAATDEAGLLIAPASSGSSEQTSPGSGNSYGGNMLSQMAAGSAYTLSGHHHHHHLNQAQHIHHHQIMQHHPSLHMTTVAGKANQPSQFHADYRTLNPNASLHCGPPGDTRWRTLHQEANKQAAGVIGYYLVR